MSETKIQTGPVDPAAQGWETLSSWGAFTEMIGPIWEHRGDSGSARTVAYGFRAEPRHMNRRDVMHGGMLMSFADSVLGNTVFGAVQAPIATISLNSDFIGVVVAGDWVEVRPQITRQGRSLVFIRGTLTVGDKAVMTADGIWKVLGRN